MNWKEIIEKRRSREAMKENLSDLRIPAQLYQIAIGEALMRLSPLERQAVGLRFLKDLPIAEVASRLGMSWDGADALIDRGLLNVRRFLKGSRFEYKGPAKETACAPPTLDDEALRDLEEIYLEDAP